MLCPQCGIDRETLPWKDDEGGDRERDICAFCAVEMFIKDYDRRIRSAEEEAARQYEKAETMRTRVYEIKKAVEAQGAEGYIKDFLAKCEA